MVRNNARIDTHISSLGPVGISTHSLTHLLGEGLAILISLAPGGDDDAPPRLEHTRHFLHVALLVRHVFAALAGPHIVEAVVRELHLQRVHHLDEVSEDRCEGAVRDRVSEDRCEGAVRNRVSEDRCEGAVRDRVSEDRCEGAVRNRVSEDRCEGAVRDRVPEDRCEGAVRDRVSEDRCEGAVRDRVSEDRCEGAVRDRVPEDRCEGAVRDRVFGTTVCGDRYR